MKKLVLSIIAGSLLFATDIGLNRKVDLLTDAVVKLINQNIQIKKELNSLKQQVKKNQEIFEKLSQNHLNALAIVTAHRLNVREKPSLKAKVIRKLKRGDVVKIYKTIVDGNKVWYRITDGYISAYYTNLVIRRAK